MQVASRSEIMRFGMFPFNTDILAEPKYFHEFGNPSWQSFHDRQPRSRRTQRSPNARRVARQPASFWDIPSLEMNNVENPWSKTNSHRESHCDCCCNYNGGVEEQTKVNKKAPSEGQTRAEEAFGKSTSREGPRKKSKRVPAYRMTREGTEKSDTEDQSRDELDQTLNDMTQQEKQTGLSSSSAMEDGVVSSGPSYTSGVDLEDEESSSSAFGETVDKSNKSQPTARESPPPEVRDEEELTDDTKVQIAKSEDLEETEKTTQSTDAELDLQEKTEANIVEKKLITIGEQLEKARQLAPRVEAFEGKRTNKECLFLEEMLLRNILNLDTVETEGIETVKQARRAAVKEIQSYLDKLERKVTA